MFETLQSQPSNPLFQQTEPNASIDFGEIQVSSASITPDPGISVTARATLRFLPDKALEIFVPSESGSLKGLGLFGPYECQIDFPQFGGKIEAVRTHRTQHASVYVPSRSPIQLHQKSSTIRRGIFHLFNWPQFLSRDDYLLETAALNPRRSRVLLQFDGWKVTITETEETERISTLFESVGGYAITHVGLVERLDETEFTSTELDDLFEALTYFFSFMLGRWSSPSLIVGRNQSDERVYQQWGLGHVARSKWVAGHSCLDVHHFEMMSDTIQGFWKRWKDKTWKKPLSDAINWYVSANHTSGGVGVDTGLLFTQSALELLAWSYCVLDRKMVSPDAFKQRGLSAANKLRLLASSMSIPATVPPQLDGLKTHPTKNKPWYDVMEAITELRNGLVHPGRDENSIGLRTYLDAWNFSLWFISMVILRLFEYQGNYGNRLTRRFAGEIEPVPWAPRVDPE